MQSPAMFEVRVSRHSLTPQQYAIISHCQIAFNYFSTIFVRLAISAEIISINLRLFLTYYMEASLFVTGERK